MKLRTTIFLALVFLSATAVSAQCAYNNTFYETKAAPVSSSTPVTTELYGGEYSTLTGLVAGYTYQIGTCGDNAFDTQITIYPAGGGNAIAFNDDYAVCAPQSRIYFTPEVSGSYDILVDEYDCMNNTTAFTTVTIELFNAPTDIVTIPTVVHVIYNTNQENISLAQINSQIDVLNEDFRYLNTDRNTAPARFTGFAKDQRVEFCLASVDPQGFATDGITRTFTSASDFNPSAGEMKFTADGGIDAWPRDSYLNIWVCDLSGQTLGFAQFPGEPAATDGVVIDYTFFGTQGAVAPPFNKGRTTTHEVGHWLDLRHIWGDDGTGCTGSDLINDTPNQAGSNFGCQTDPTSCNNGGLGGDMYVNYMDYSDDRCLTMFTYWQYRRIYATLTGERNSLRSSGGCGAMAAARDPQFQEIAVQVYPNPASESATFAMDLRPGQLKGMEFQLFDLMGKEVKALSALRSATFEVPLGQLPAGVYLYKLTGKSGLHANGKLVIE